MRTGHRADGFEIMSILLTDLITATATPLKLDTLPGEQPWSRLGPNLLCTECGALPRRRGLGDTGAALSLCARARGPRLRCGAAAGGYYRSGCGYDAYVPEPAPSELSDATPLAHADQARNVPEVTTWRRVFRRGTSYVSISARMKAPSGRVRLAGHRPTIADCFVLEALLRLHSWKPRSDNRPACPKRLGSSWNTQRPEDRRGRTSVERPCAL